MTLSLLARRDEVGLTDGMLLVDGTWRPAASGETWTHTHPATGEAIGDIAIAGQSDVDAAVRAAGGRAECVRGLHGTETVLMPLGEELM